MSTKRLYRVTPTDTETFGTAFDTYGGMVVVAKDPDHAMSFHPDGQSGEEAEAERRDSLFDTWPTPANWRTLHVELLGEASSELGYGLILSSFTAG